ncbi:MAG: 4Fe-4S double cluster binding domain-containing protein [Desulfomonilia bacterium]
MSLSISAVEEKACELGFGDVGITSADEFISQRELLHTMQAEYDWVIRMGLDLISGTDPKTILPNAKSIIVLVEEYFREAFPLSMEHHFGRCYLDDDRVTKDRLSKRIKTFRSFLRDHGVTSKVPFNLPHRMAAARAGLGSFGKNTLFYSRKAALKGSWVLPVALVVDHAFEPGEASCEVSCPDWCKNACITACPTGALKGPRRIDPRRCISYLTYFGDGITPRDLREPMGMWVYGCDHCQNVCPRNAPWLAKARDLPLNQKVSAMQEDFSLRRLLHMDSLYFKERIWPHMFYMPDGDIWRWKMNVARAMGNSLDETYIPDLIRLFSENSDERVAGMAAWALGRIGGSRAFTALERFLPGSAPPVREEIIHALERRYAYR